MTREDTRKRILESALDLFSSQGYRSTTTKEIAERSGLNELTLFRYFRTKENLLENVIDHGYDLEGLKGSIHLELTGDVEEDLYDFILQMRQIINSRDRVFAVMLREMSTNEVIRKKMTRFPTIMKSFMLEKLKEVMGGKQRNDVDMETAGIFLASYYLRSEMMSIMLGKDPFHELDESRIREAVSIFLHGYLEGGSS